MTNYIKTAMTTMMVAILILVGVVAILFSISISNYQPDPLLLSVGLLISAVVVWILLLVAFINFIFGKIAEGVRRD